MNNLALHFLTESPWQVEDLREQRLKLILQVLRGREINLIIDETGDRKKGNKTDYVKRRLLRRVSNVSGNSDDLVSNAAHSSAVNRLILASEVIAA